ncbi:hypothetical protein L0U85_03495 [Glycomyces sp. L485]|uniref:hypothetical protein n=1 Tax=Glycomyces sp. L485 TaxID=2909235 RepID=UPI001F4B4CEF|nr:hypothetical protein [Glycomyces sp. L485]MCH7229926.1 hypothetical protein [Glycomyces sp. L485]
MLYAVDQGLLSNAASVRRSGDFYETGTDCDTPPRRHVTASRVDLHHTGGLPFRPPRCQRQTRSRHPDGA